ncbi:MAG: hypothetical protein ABIG39_06375 [Candidatus Micrarchaeota archaeon]
MRGQAASMDLILSTVLFALLAFSIMSFLHTEIKSADSKFLDEKRDRLTNFAAYQLIFLSGRPDNWNSSNCDRIGLSCSQGSLCTSKISEIEAMYSSDYNETRNLLNLVAYDVSIHICSTGNYSDCDYNFTTQDREADRAASSSVSRAELVSTLNGELVSVIVYAWS